MTVDAIRSLVQQADTLDKQSVRTANELKRQLEESQHRLMLVAEAQALLQKVATDTQSHLRFQIEDIVNLALDTCVPDEYTFSITFDIRGGRTEAGLGFISKATGRPVDPMNASGGGVVDLTAFALRMASYALDATCDNVMILDEPFRFLSRDLQGRAGEILKVLSQRLGLQVIMVSHIGDIINAADRIFEVRKGADGVSRVVAKDNDS